MFTKILDLSKKFPDLHNDNYKSNGNFIQQLLMLQEASNFLSSNFTLAIRDDLKVNFQSLTENLIKARKHITDKKMVTSFYHSNRGLSERWTFSNRKTAEILLTRSRFVKKFLAESHKLIIACNRV